MKTLLFILLLFCISPSYTGSVTIEYLPNTKCTEGGFKVVHLDPGCSNPRWYMVQWQGLNPVTYNWEMLSSPRGFYLCYDPQKRYKAWRAKIITCNQELYSNIIYDNYF